MQSTVGSRYFSPLGGGDAVHCAVAHVKGHVKAVGILHHDVSRDAGGSCIKISILILNAIDSHAGSTSRTGFGSIFCGDIKEQRIPHRRRDNYLRAYNGSRPSPGGIIQSFAIFRIERDKARASITLPTGSLSGSMAVCIAIGGVTAAAGAANLRNTALVFYLGTCLFSLDGVAEELAVIGIASFHRVVGHSSIDEIITSGKNKCAYRAFPCSSTAVEILPLQALQIHVETNRICKVQDVCFMVTEFGSRIKSGLNGIVFQFRVGNQQIAVVIHRHTNGELRGAGEHKLIALENKLIGDSRLIHQVHTNTGVHRIPVATRFLRFGERGASETNGADCACGEREIGRHALGNGGNYIVGIGCRIHDGIGVGCGNEIGAGVEVCRSDSCCGGGGRFDVAIDYRGVVTRSGHGSATHGGSFGARVLLLHAILTGGEIIGSVVTHSILFLSRLDCLVGDRKRSPIGFCFR